MSDEIKSRSEMKRIMTVAPGVVIAQMERYREENETLRRELERSKNTFRSLVGFEPFYGLEPRLASEAIASIDAVLNKKAEGG